MCLQNRSVHKCLSALFTTVSSCKHDRSPQTDEEINKLCNVPNKEVYLLKIKRKVFFPALV